MNTLPAWICYLVSAGFGLVFGSFFNVVICRLPAGESLGSRSRCPGCGEAIRWYDNVPLLSFVLLRGRCRSCGMNISWRYPVVELSSALLFVLVYWWSTSIVPGLLDVPGGKPLQPELFLGLLLVSCLIITSATDISEGIIPNKVIMVGTALMLPLLIGLALYRREPGRIPIALGVALGGAAFFLAAGLLYGLLFMRGGGQPARRRGEEGSLEEPGFAGEISRDETCSLESAEDTGLASGIGAGDIKLMLLTGLALGYFHWYFLVIHIFLSALIGTLAAVPLKIFAGKGRKDRVPFGPFLAAGAIITLVWGQALADLYVKLLR